MIEEANKVYYLDPDHIDFVAHKSELNFETLTWVSDNDVENFGGLAIVGLLMTIVMVVASIVTIYSEWMYHFSVEPIEVHIAESHTLSLVFILLMFVIALSINYLTFPSVFNLVKAKISYFILNRVALVIKGNIIDVIEINRRHSEFVRITYKFETPDRRMLQRKFDMKRRDFPRKKSPQSGARIMVLYANDFAVTML